MLRLCSRYFLFSFPLNFLSLFQGPNSSFSVKYLFGYTNNDTDLSYIHVGANMSINLNLNLSESECHILVNELFLKFDNDLSGDLNFEEFRNFYLKLLDSEECIDLLVRFAQYRFRDLKKEIYANELKEIERQRVERKNKNREERHRLVLIKNEQEKEKEKERTRVKQIENVHAPETKSGNEKEHEKTNDSEIKEGSKIIKENDQLDNYKGDNSNNDKNDGNDKNEEYGDKEYRFHDNDLQIMIKEEKINDIDNVNNINDMTFADYILVISSPVDLLEIKRNKLKKDKMILLERRNKIQANFKNKSRLKYVDERKVLETPIQKKSMQNIVSTDSLELERALRSCLIHSNNDESNASHKININNTLPTTNATYNLSFITNNPAVTVTHTEVLSIAATAQTHLPDKKTDKIKNKKKHDNNNTNKNVNHNNNNNNDDNDDVSAITRVVKYSLSLTSLSSTLTHPAAVGYYLLCNDRLGNASDNNNDSNYDFTNHAYSNDNIDIKIRNNPHYIHPAYFFSDYVKNSKVNNKHDALGVVRLISKTYDQNSMDKKNSKCENDQMKKSSRNNESIITIKNDSAILENSNNKRNNINEREGNISYNIDNMYNHSNSNNTLLSAYISTITLDNLPSNVNLNTPLVSSCSSPSSQLYIEVDLTHVLYSNTKNSNENDNQPPTSAITNTPQYIYKALSTPTNTLITTPSTTAYWKEPFKEPFHISNSITNDNNDDDQNGTDNITGNSNSNKNKNNTNMNHQSFLPEINEMKRESRNCSPSLSISIYNGKEVFGRVSVSVKALVALKRSSSSDDEGNIVVSREN